MPTEGPAAAYARDLKADIGEGRLAPGDVLPDVLFAGSGLGRDQLAEALDRLTAEGLLITAPGGSHVVLSSGLDVRRVAYERYQWEKDRALQPESVRYSTGATERDTGSATSDLLFTAEYEVVEATPELARRLDVRWRDALLRRTYLTRHRSADRAFSTSSSYLRHEDAARNPALLDPANEPWPGGTMHQLRTIGIEVDHVIDEIGLDPSGQPQLRVRKTMVDTRGRPAELAEIRFPQGTTELVYRTQLSPWPEES